MHIYYLFVSHRTQVVAGLRVYRPHRKTQDGRRVKVRDGRGRRRFTLVVGLTPQKIRNENIKIDDKD